MPAGSSLNGTADLRTLDGPTTRSGTAAALPGSSQRLARVPRTAAPASTHSEKGAPLAEVGSQGAAGGRRSLRPPDAPLASEDAPLHLRRARRHLHHRPAEDRGPAGAGARLRRRTSPSKGGMVLFVGTKKQAKDTIKEVAEDGRHALRARALAGRPADQLQHDPQAHRPAARPARGSPRRASSTLLPDQGAHVDGGRARKLDDQPQRRRGTWSGCRTRCS